MNITEAKHLNTLLVWMLTYVDDEAELPAHDDVREAAAALADRALAALGCGISGDDVREVWPELDWVPPTGPRVETVHATGDRL